MRHHVLSDEPDRAKTDRRGGRPARPARQIRGRITRGLDAYDWCAPAVSPLMHRRRSRPESTIVGSAARIDAAEIRLLSVKYCPCRFRSDDVTGRLSPELIRTTAHRKSL